MALAPIRLLPVDRRSTPPATLALCAILVLLLLVPAAARAGLLPATAPADLDGDGIGDAVFANLNQPARVCFGDGLGGFASCENVSGDPFASFGVGLADLDADGSVDLVFADAGGANQGCLNDGSGAFNCAALPGPSGGTTALGDMDGDGDVDAVFTVYNGNNQLCTNDGSGSFTCSNVSADVGGFAGVALGDLDGDGRLDAIFIQRSGANNDGPTLVCLNAGGGAFTCSNGSADLFTTLGVALGDVDGDGHLDAVLATLNLPSQVCINDGTGHFACADISADVFNGQDVALGDLDGDGDLDAVIPSFYETSRVCLNVSNEGGNSGVAFACSALGAEALPTRRVALGDLDADGDLDAVLANQDQVDRVCANDGTGQFTACADVDGEELASQAVALNAVLPSPNAAPVAVCKDVTLAAGAACTAVVAGGDVDDGSFDPNPGDALTLSVDPAGPFAAGTSQVVTLTATDEHGAASSCNATVTVVDSTPPSLAPPSGPPEWAATSLAGAGSGAGSGTADGPAAAARFYYPTAVAADAAGNVYVADTGNHTLRKIDAAGVVTTLAGLPGVWWGGGDGIGSAARFHDPGGVAVDAAGNVYVADTGNHTIRKVTPAGEVTTLAGLAGYTGSDDGTGGDARFNYPYGIALDAAGDLYVVDSSNQTIRRVTPAGEVTTLAGSPGATGSDDGTGSAARFYYPIGVAVGGDGNLYVADRANQTIRKITPSGEVTTLAGTAGEVGSADGTGSAARFFYPWAVAVDGSGNVFATDAQNHTIRKITPAGEVTTLAGAAGVPGGADAAGSAARFNYPYGLAADGGGNLYVADSQNHSIRKVMAAGAVTTLAGPAGAAGSVDGAGSAARFFSPNGVAADAAGNVYVADTGNHTIRRIDPAGAVTTFAGAAGAAGSADGTAGAARFRSPRGVAVDASGTVYVADTENHTIRKIDATGTVTTLAGAPGSRGGTDGAGGAARFDNPYGVAVDAAGHVYVADTVNHTIRMIDPAGVVSTLAGTTYAIGSADGLGAAARFFYPSGVAVDGAGMVYVADTYNFTIRRITPAGEVTTLAGAAGDAGSADGAGGAARFYFPSGVAVDGAGDLYVADTYNQTIRKVTAAGEVTTVAGTPLAPDTTDGTGSAARFHDPSGVAVDGAGNLYVADTGNHTIRKLTDVAPPLDYSAPADAACIAPAPDLTAEVTVGDNCGAVTVSQDPPAGTPLPVGEHSVVVTATDGAGNSSTVEVPFAVVDDAPPTFTIPPVDLGASADAGCQALVPDFTAGVEAAGRCGPATLSQSPDAGSPRGLGSHPVQVTATTGAGADSVVEVYFEVVDDTAPEFAIVPADRSELADASCQAPVPSLTAEAAASDGCGAVTFTQNPIAGTPLPVGEYAVTITATDGAGNPTSVDVFFDVVDDAPPVFTTLPVDQSVAPDASCQALVPDFTAGAAATDACGAVTLSQNPAIGTSVPLGHHEIFVIATDGAGNESVSPSVFLDVVDPDGDSVCGAADNCPATFNPDQADADLDGAGDACDACPLDPLDDVDGDGFCGDVDNCPAVANPGQSNIDGDGYGDVCDACPSDVDNTACDPTGSTAQELGPGGGTLQTPDGGLTLTFPPGVLAAPTTIAVTDQNANPALPVNLGIGSGSALAIYDLQPEGLTFPPPGVTLSVVHDVSGLFPIGKRFLVKMTRFEPLPAPGAFVQVPGSSCPYNAVTKTVTCTAQINHFSLWALVLPHARTAVREVRNDLQALRAGGTCGRDADKDLDKAIEDLAKATQNENWVNDNTLDPGKGKKAFDGTESAVKNLANITKRGGLCTGAARAAVGTLVTTAEGLAQAAIDQAQAACAAGTDPKKKNECQKEVDKAKEEMVKAAEELADGKPDKAVSHYAKAWDHAQKARDKMKMK